MGQKYNKIGVFKKIDFGPIWDLGGSRWVQNTPIGCRNHFPSSRNMFEMCVVGEICLGYSCLCGLETGFTKVAICLHVWATHHYQHDRMVREKRLRVQGKFSCCWRNVTKTIPEVDLPPFQVTL